MASIWASWSCSRVGKVADGVLCFTDMGTKRHKLLVFVVWLCRLGWVGLSVTFRHGESCDDNDDSDDDDDDAVEAHDVGEGVDDDDDNDQDEDYHRDSSGDGDGVMMPHDVDAAVLLAVSVKVPGMM